MDLNISTQTPEKNFYCKLSNTNKVATTTATSTITLPKNQENQENQENQ